MDRTDLTVQKGDYRLTDEQLANPFLHRQGPPLQYDRPIIERALFEVAAQGGNARKAHVALKAIGIEIPAETMYNWKKGRFRNVYQEIASRQVDDLREIISRQAVDLAIQLGQAEQDAIKQVLNGLHDLNAVEASIALRNLSTSKGINVDQEGKLRGRAGIVVDHRGLEDIAQALLRLGVASPIDGEVVGDVEVVG